MRWFKSMRLVWEQLAVEARVTVVFKHCFSKGGEKDVECQICHKVYRESKSLLRLHLRMDSGMMCRDAMMVSFLAADLGDGDVDSDRQFVLDWFDCL